MSPLQLDLNTSAPHSSHTDTNNSSPTSSNCDSNAVPSPVELKIPSYKPMKSTFASNMTAMTSPNSDDGLPASPGIDSIMANNRMGDTLKDMIAKTIAEKVRCRTQLNGGGVYANGQASPLATHNNNSCNIPISLEPSVIPNKRRRLEPKPQGSSSKRQAAESLADQSGKKTRPKRGQYRKYNSQLLIEAVKAVQRGEMSVHRAGSYFGVPHSTLEYKVKERHLLRQKKPRETKAGGESNGNNNKSSAAGSPTEKIKAESGVSATSTASSSGLNAVPLSPSVSLSGSLSSSECSLSRGSSQNDVKKETPSCSTSSSPEPQSHADSPMTSPVKKESLGETPPAIPNGPSASELLMAHANEMFMAANNPAMMQLAHQAALSSLALGNPFPLLAAGWGQPNGFLPMGLPDPAMMAAAAAAAGYPGIPPASGGNFPGVNTSASDLLKKLQQKATRHNSTDSLEPGEISRVLNAVSSPGSPPDPTSQQVAAQ